MARTRGKDLLIVVGCVVLAKVARRRRQHCDAAKVTHQKVDSPVALSRFLSASGYVYRP
jgi:hypothetical protein